MNAGALIFAWISNLIKKHGQTKAINEVARYVGSFIAANAVKAVVQGSVTKALAALGGKIGALAGPIGVAAGILAGAL